MENYWYVYKKFGGSPHFKHPSFDSAVAEAKRLVDTVGGEYEILEATAVVRAAPKHVVETLSTRVYTGPPF
jgi:hypothetical protein